MYVDTVTKAKLALDITTATINDGNGVRKIVLGIPLTATDIEMGTVELRESFQYVSLSSTSIPVEYAQTTVIDLDESSLPVRDHVDFVLHQLAEDAQTQAIISDSRYEFSYENGDRVQVEALEVDLSGFVPLPFPDGVRASVDAITTSQRAEEIANGRGGPTLSITVRLLPAKQA